MSSAAEKSFPENALRVRGGFVRAPGGSKGRAENLTLSIRPLKKPSTNSAPVAFHSSSCAHPTTNGHALNRSPRWRRLAYGTGGPSRPPSGFARSSPTPCPAAHHRWSLLESLAERKYAVSIGPSRGVTGLLRQ